MRAIIICFLQLFAVSCNQLPSTQEHVEATGIISDSPSTRPETDYIAEKVDYQDTPFSLIQQFPLIGDTAAFIAALKENCHLNSNSRYESINYSRKIHIYGSAKTFYLVEYDFHDGAGSSFPWKNQLLFDEAGYLKQVFVEIRIDLVIIFPNQYPFLVGVTATSKGNGRHHVYSLAGDSVVNVLNDFAGESPLRTYDRHHDNLINEPFELPYTIRDVNHDGFNDISFDGKVVLIEYRSKYGDWASGVDSNGRSYHFDERNPFKKIPVRYTFLYNQNSGRFIEAEDYEKKYGFLN